MDYRDRKYYLVKFSDNTYDKWIKKIKTDIPDVKIHSPYYHFAHYSDKYDGEIIHKYVQNMISCKKEDSIIFERKMMVAAFMDLAWYQEINKEICLQ